MADEPRKVVVKKRHSVAVEKPVHLQLKRTPTLKDPDVQKLLQKYSSKKKLDRNPHLDKLEQTKQIVETLAHELAYDSALKFNQTQLLELKCE